jgi:uncharacterized protein YciI
MAVLVATLAALFAQAAPAPTAAPPTEMTQYFMVFLRRGPAWTSAVTPETRAVSAGHMANIQAMTKAGKLLVAGPFADQEGERALAGIFILKVATTEEAKALVETDPAVQAGRFVYEIAPWYGPTTLRY